MNIYDVITKKKRGESLTKEEIFYFVNGYTMGEISDYQISALLMAICLKGMDGRETGDLTEAIMLSGDVVNLERFGDATADKHSTGGVGDKTTLIVAPLAASLGCKVAKMSGRGLGHTGGTVDKLESIPGYNVTPSPEEFIRIVDTVGVSVIGQSGNLAPADKKLYALRDVTATVDSIPLIASSIMGKKLASGAKNIVLDVKYGSGAFMKTADNAKLLAEKMVNIGKSLGRRVAALITNMDMPLGYAIGNSLEVIEAVEVLRGRGPSDLTEICIALAASMASLTLSIPKEIATPRAREALASGRAYEKFKEWQKAQGADISYIENTDLFESAKFKHEIKASRSGFITKMDTEGIGASALALGAGRRTKDEDIDYSAGIILNKKTGDYVSEGNTIATLLSSSMEKIDTAAEIFARSIDFSNSAPKAEPLIFGAAD